MRPTQGPQILQLCMGPSYFWRGLTSPDPPLFRTLVSLIVTQHQVNNATNNYSDNFTYLPNIPSCREYLTPSSLQLTNQVGVVTWQAPPLLAY